jgi:putative sugar O-methyltransferase
LDGIGPEGSGVKSSRQREELLVRRAELKAAKRQAEDERAVRKQEERARLESEQRALDAIGAKAFDDYLLVRESARRMRECEDQAALAYTEHERCTIDGLAPLWTASREAVAQLRRWCEPLSSVRLVHYESESSELATRLKRELSMLRRQGAQELFVQESRALGGFGFEKHGELYNEDTLTFFKARVALHDGAVLQAHQASTERRLVWEIGGGWGGFAFQFKTLFPNVTYLITGLPDAFLVSAVYLKAVFPDARCRFFSGSSPADLFRQWEDADFIFAPESALRVLQPPRIDLTVDIATLSRMRVDRVRAHVRRAFDLGCRYVYSLCPPGGPDPQAMVSDEVRRFYWPHPIPARRERWAPAVMGVEPEPRPDTEEAHLVGWRRLCA